MTRILLCVNAVMLAAAAVRAESIGRFSPILLESAAYIEPVLIASLVLFYVAQPVLARMHPLAGLGAVLVAEFVLIVAVFNIGGAVGEEMSTPLLMRGWAWCVALTLFLRGYFQLRSKAFSPALAEARLAALQARIRPHFLFNSLNAVLSLVRRDARRAEGALEDLADLFRVLMGDNRQLTPLVGEIELTRRYLSLEQLRLGDRLVVEWDLEGMPADALIPPLLLQPLVENAVYHGIEPGMTPGAIRIAIRRDGDRLRLALSNPYHPEHQHRAGNRMALANIRERLQLQFDVEAQLEAEPQGGNYEIRIAMPYRT